jgi:hypothetical protein
MAVSRIYCATGLTGGTTGKLDTINGSDLADKDMAIVCDQTTFYFYVLDDDSGAAESSPDVISPDDNAGDKRWLLQSIHVNDLTISDDIILATDDVKIGDTLEVVGSTQFGDADGTGADVTFYSDTAGDTMVFDASAKTFTITDVQLIVNNLDVNDGGDGAIDGCIIGANTAAAITGTTIDATTDFTIGDTIITDGVITDATGLSIAAACDFNNNALTNVDINSGTLNGVTIDGGLTWSAAQDLNSQEFTNINIDSGAIDGATLAANSACTIGGGLTWSAAQDLNNQNLTNVDIDSGTIDGVTIGGASAPTVTDLGSVATCDINGGTIDGVTIGAAAAPTVTDLGSVATCDINGGAIDGTAIGAASPSTIVGTTITANTEFVLASDARLDFTTPASDGKATGIVKPGETVDTNTAGWGGLVYLNSADSHWDTADKDSTSTGGDVIVAMALGTTGAIDLLMYGEVHETDWNWTVGAVLYLGDDGALTETCPSDSGDVVRIMGHATHADKVWFNPSPDWAEVA